MNKFFIALAAVVFLSSGSFVGAQSGSVVAEEVAAVVGNMTIMLSDIEREAARIVEDNKVNGVRSPIPAKDQAFEMLLHQKLLATAAKADSLDKDMRSVEGRVEEIVTGMVKESGSITALERKMGKAIFQIRNELADDLTQMQLAQMMEDKVRSKVSITTPDVERFYTTLPLDSLPKIPAQYIYAQIVKMPSNTDARKLEIREKLLGYRQRVLSGERFSTLATLYSQDRGSAIRGGEIGPQSLDSFVKPFAEAVEGLKPGQISEIVETEFGFHIIELISLKDGQAHIRHLLLSPEFTLDEMYRASSELDSIAREIRAGTITFEAAALKYSQDKDSKMNGGVVFNTGLYYQTGDVRNASARFVSDEIQPAEYRVLNKLKIGQVSDSYESMDRSSAVYRIIKLVDIIPSHTANLKYDYEIIEMATLNDKQNRVMDSWIDKAIDRTYIAIAPSYRKYKLARGTWLKPYKSLIEQGENTSK